VSRKFISLIDDDSFSTDKIESKPNKTMKSSITSRKILMTQMNIGQRLLKLNNLVTVLLNNNAKNYIISNW